jgi:putative ABC transport system permease protein
LLERAEEQQYLWNLVLGSIAGISLVVGGIGIMNIMLANVTEQTREIGIRRAIGARQQDIVAQFLTESVVLCSVGGLLGVAVGVAIPRVVEQFAGIEAVVRLWSVLLAFGISTGMGVLFGIYPAARAARMDPIQALRNV